MPGIVMPSSMGPLLRAVALALPWLAYLFVADVALSLLLPLRLLAPRLVYDGSSHIAASVWAWIQLLFVRANGADIVCSGDALALRSHMLGRCRYFAKRQLRMVPFLGWGIWAMGMPMAWLISFSEATRFTRAKHDESRAWCKKMDKPQPRHLLYPRTKGFVKTVQHLRRAPHVAAVYDLTIAYQHRGAFQAAPSMLETLGVPGLSSRGGFKFHVHARRFPIETLPASDEELARWLEERWLEKGEWLEAKRQKWLQQAA